MAQRRQIDDGESKQDQGPMGQFEGGSPLGGVDQWGNPPSGYQPGQDYGMGGAGGSAESPRERAGIQGGVSHLPEAPHPGGGGGGITSTPRQPATPSPAQGSTFEAGPPDVGTMQGLQPFAPMGGPDPTTMASPRLRSIYGSQGGLQGGGLGVPGSTSPAQNDPISQLIQQLLASSGA